jgi:hypothetical protein
MGSHDCAPTAECPDRHGPQQRKSAAKSAQNGVRVKSLGKQSLVTVHGTSAAGRRGGGAAMMNCSSSGRYHSIVCKWYMGMVVFVCGFLAIPMQALNFSKVNEKSPIVNQ